MLGPAGWRSAYVGKWHLDDPRETASPGQGLREIDTRWDRPQRKRGYWSDHKPPRYLTNELTDRALAVLGGAPTGYTSHAPLRGSKGDPYEGGVRVPLIVRWPGVSVAGAVSSVPVHGIDLVPTILDATGVEYSSRRGHELPGLSLRGVQGAPERPVERDLFWHYPHYRALGDQRPFSAMRAQRDARGLPEADRVLRGRTPRAVRPRLGPQSCGWSRCSSQASKLGS